jgi:hypothetical protein
MEKKSEFSLILNKTPIILDKNISNLKGKSLPRIVFVASTLRQCVTGCTMYHAGH